MSNDALLRALGKGAETFNRWRTANANVKELTATDFAEHIPAGQTRLEHYDFSRMNLVGCKFPAVLFVNCDFSYTTLSDCSMPVNRVPGREIGFTDCEFTEATLEDCDFSYAAMTRCDFGNAELSRLKLLNCTWRANTASQATFKAVSFDSAHFPKENGEPLNGAVFENCNFHAASFGDPYDKNTNPVFYSNRASPLRAARFKDCNFALSRGFEVDANHMEACTFQPVPPRRLWEKIPFGASQLTRYENLKFHYTGMKSLFIVLLTCLFFLPILLEIVFYKGQNELHVANTKAVEAVTAYLDDLPPQVPDSWKRKVIEASSVSPCVAEECKSVPIWALVLGVGKGTGWVLLTVSLILYNLGRIVLTYVINGYRDREPDAGQPALASYGWMWWAHLGCNLLFYISIVNFLWQLWGVMTSRILIPT